MSAVLLVDDDPDLLELLAMSIESRGYRVETALSADAALQRIEADAASYDVVITDYQMPGTDGVRFGKWVQDNRGWPTILLTGQGSKDVLIEALRAGLFDFHEKPVDTDVLLHAVERACRYRRLEVRLQQIEDAPAPEPSQLLGDSAAMRQVIDRVRRVAPADVGVLITGETGTGKEIVARALHELGPRSKGPFVAVNCTAIPESLLESELFGHVKGAFTGAEGHSGLFTEADGGTLFLDELGEMPLSMQAKLLRALQEQSVRPVGGAEEHPFDARVIAATNRDLELDVEEGRFREDLYYRILVVHIPLPPLRSRDTDVLLLADTFVRRLAAKLDRPVQGLDASAARALLRYSWPGNVRELEAAIQHAVALTTTDRIVEADLPERVRLAPPRSSVEQKDNDPDVLPTLEDVERAHIERVLRACEGNKAHTSRVLGVDRRTLYRKLERYGLDDIDLS